MTDMGRNVLVIDDAPEVIELLAVTFRKSLDCNVTEALHVCQAVNLIRTIRSDLIITDFHMPDGGGVAVAHAVIKSQPQTPLVFFSAADLPSELRVENMAFPVIKKPSVPELLKFASEIRGWPLKWPNTGLTQANIH